MTDAHHNKPSPARPPGQKPTPVRELDGEPSVPPVEADLALAHVEVDGKRWTVRVLGRSGRASVASAPILLLGFWEGGDTDGLPSLEAMVPARALRGLSAEALEAAYRRAAPPLDPDRKRVFFQDAGQARRR